MTALLAKPVSLATVASLVAHATHPAAQSRLADALRDPRAPVRAVAARVAFVTASRGLIAAGRTALAAEQDPEAANELIRLIVTYGGAPALEDAWQAVDRLKAYRLPALAESLARNDRPELLSLLPRLLANAMVDDAIVDAVLTRTANDPEQRTRAIATLLEDNRRPVTLLTVLGRRKEAPPADLMTGWLRSTDVGTRLVALGFLVEEVGQATGKDPLKDLGIDVDDWRASLQDSVTMETLAIEALARAAGRSKTERDWSRLGAAVGFGSIDFRGPRSLWLAHFSDQELATLSDTFMGGRDVLIGNLRAALAVAGSPRPMEPMRMVPSFAAGLWRELGELHGCGGRVDGALAARMTYKPEGRARSVRILNGESPKCVATAGTLFSLTLFGEGRVAPAEYEETLVLPWQKDVLACADEPSTWTRPKDRMEHLAFAPRKIAAPKKTRHVNPSYPVVAQRAGAQGAALFEGVINVVGCMRDLRLISTASHPLLDLAGLMAVSQWRYTPTLLEGTPVPVVMTVTVNFTLQ